MVTKYQDKNFLNATLVKILTTVSEKAPYFLFLRVSQNNNNSDIVLKNKV